MATHIRSLVVQVTAVLLLIRLIANAPGKAMQDDWAPATPWKKTQMEFWAPNSNLAQS